MDMNRIRRALNQPYGRCHRCGIKTPRTTKTLEGTIHRCASCARLLTLKVQAQARKARAWLAGAWEA